MYSRLNPDSFIDFGTRRPYACIREWMRMNRCSQNKLAGRIGVSGSYLSRILRGERYMTLDIGRKLSAETGIPLRQIFIDILNEQAYLLKKGGKMYQIQTSYYSQMR
mgnify:CR=1 FL=1